MGATLARCLDLPHPYLVAVCGSSSVDQRSNNFSLFVLVEAVQLPVVPTTLPLEMHVYYEFEEAEVGRPYQVRVELVDQRGISRWQSPWTPVTSLSRRHRVVLAGLGIPDAGYFHLFAAMRPDGEPVDDAQRSSFGWPFEVTRAEAPPGGQRPA